jgi:anhydro-N-acetylmuramic acid kinase
MRVAGIMSGTSLDGIDVAIADIQGRKIRTVAHRTTAYPQALRARILGVSNATTATGEISRLNFELGEWYARAVKAVCSRSKTPLASIELIGCHGQTIYHESGRNTLQIGEAAVLAERLGIPVVSDFRPRDIAAGGKGAPLAPFLDQLLFPDRRRTRVALNLGGIANITVLRRDGGVVAFDTGPGNLVIDQLVEEHSGGRLRFDRGGRIAASGKVSKELLTDLMSDPYYKRKPPKTAGREEYGREFIGRCKRAGLPFADLIATVTVLTAATVALAVGQQAPDAEELIVSGGGAHNPRIMAHLASLLAGVAISTTSDYGVDVDAKEAILFALMAHETWLRRPSNVPQATGARRAVVLGKVSY